MAETDNRQQNMQETARRLAAQQAEAQRMVIQRQQAARKAQQEAEQARRESAQAQKNATVPGRNTTMAAPQNAAASKRQQQGQKDDVARQMQTGAFSDLVIVGSERASSKKSIGSYVDRKAADKPQSNRTYSRDTSEEDEGSERLRHWGKVGHWFQTFCWMHIPIFGFWYMVVMALRKKNSEERRAFAKAYVLYRFLVFLLAITILYVLYQMGLSFLEQILSYVDLHS